jgi:hypothetical protein
MTELMLDILTYQLRLRSERRYIEPGLARKRLFSKRIRDGHCVIKIKLDTEEREEET